MKATLSLILATVCCFFSFNVLIAQGDSAIVASKYVGAFYIGSYDPNGVLKNDVTVRIGGDAVLPIYEYMTLNTRAGYDICESTGKAMAFGKFFLERKSPVVDAAMGFMPRPITFAFRPAPLSADGHFEPPALAAIPGCNTGAYVAKQIGDEGPSLMAGPYYLASSRSVEWNASARQNIDSSLEIRVAGFSSRIRKGVAVGIHIGEASITGFTTSDSVLTALLVVPTPIATPYFNVNYSRARHDYDNFEIGIVKTYCLPYGGAKMLVGIGYQFNTRFLNTYVQLYLM